MSQAQAGNLSQFFGQIDRDNNASLDKTQASRNNSVHMVLTVGDEQVSEMHDAQIRQAG